MATAPETRLRTSVVIIGAGWYGIAAAKTYLQFDPTIDLTVIDSEDGVGGVWGASRIYPGLVADSPAGLFEFSDLKMSKELGIEEWAGISGQDVQKYLEHYARHHDVLERCRFRTTVTRVSRMDQKWVLQIKTSDHSDGVLHCDKLIVATGITSKPRFPQIPMANYNGAIIHSKDLGRMHSFLTSAEVNNVVVVGGNKSAVEAVTLCATAGKTVTWLIRPDGSGPGILLNPRRNGKHLAENAASRWTGLFRPGLYAPRPWIHRFFYSGKNKLGTWLCKQFWKMMTRMMLTSQLSTHPNRKLLNPESKDFFWPTTSVSIMHGPTQELMRLVEDGTLVHVHRKSIVAMKDRCVQISDGRSIQADAVVFATGWGPSHTTVFETDLADELGLPRPLSEEDAVQAAYWKNLQAIGEEEVLNLYPILRDPPYPPRTRAITPCRLFRTVAPPKLAARRDHSIAFVGLLANNQVSWHAEISGLWAVSYLTGQLYKAPIGQTLADRSEMDLDVATMNAFIEKRYLGRKDVPDAAMEIQDYIDLMMRDMGLRPDRRRMQAPASWFGWKAFRAEYLTPYMPRDYLGVATEFLAKYRDI